MTLEKKLKKYLCCSCLYSWLFFSGGVSLLFLFFLFQLSCLFLFFNFHGGLIFPFLFTLIFVFYKTTL